MENSKKNILVAPLNWGLGHATRCIPIIRELEKNGFIPVLASDGVALQLLQKEFPHLQSLELPSYEIEYAKNGSDFKWKLIKNSPKMIEAIFAEKRIVKKWIAEFSLQGIISDNRLGIYSKKIPSVFITHQLNVLSGKTTWISSKLHQHFIKKFTECWIPDIQENPNLTGKLGHLKNSSPNLKYIGPLSRLEKKDLPIKYDLMVILSGPEPQRTFLEKKLISEVRRFSGQVIFIKGLIESEQKIVQQENVIYYNFMTSSEIETAFNESEIVLCRSGYTTVMDLAKLQKKAFFIPTPGQFEQEYLAKRLKRNGFVPYAKQDDFKIENLLQVQLYQGLPQLKKEISWKQLLMLFERE
ncbi:glycosyltransferase [Flavobacterium paronense]|uniref:Glycosyltransferase n=1 Tax=Flavobacterium paronense TaxID=1392775 RepID=A0ABV5GDZ7_9FLAO|nr:glycosyltransferase [Flavobacterium paronense]MDN3678151.1 glycosyltransferase [Flavobacterium paronense]